MAIAVTNLDSNISTTDATSYATAVIPVSSHYNELFTVLVFSIGAADPNIPTFLTPRGLSLTQIKTQLGTTDHARITLFASCISSGGSSGLFTIDFAGQTQTVCAWDINTWTGTAATAGNNGADGIGQNGSSIAQSNAISLTITLPTLQNGSGTYGAFAHAANEATVAGAGYSNLAAAGLNVGAPTTGFRSFRRFVGANTPGDNTPNATWTSSVHRYGIGAEILLAPTAGSETAFVGAIPI